ncbi:MAG TPA: M20/M25/M40 family metallo-hydrolase [Promineifilum sp.]|nr:M20/M25/M40 family metallo-hydrolase [Promineifilum sp.]HQF71003.1 M20/M25/M40 family metallo-hydrolase [Promineifilum sp.]
MNDLLRSLVEAYGPSGFEDAVRDLIRPLVEPHADAVSVDAMGNLLVHKGPAAEGALKVMIAAHIDEIGVMVTHITAKGFLRFTNIGGVMAHTLLGNRVRFADGTIGVIGVDHSDDRTVVQPLSKHFIDVGATSREDCPVRVGDAAHFDRAFVTRGNYLTAKSMDDRIGCYVAIEALRRLPAGAPHDVTFVFCVQEEVGTRGAEAAANRILPDVGIALDVTRTGDVPEAKAMSVSLGDGPAIKVRDSGMIAHAGLVRLMRRRAEEAGIRYQMEVLEGGSTDARAMQIAGPGCAAGCISIPCRYVHSPSETVDSRDVEGSIQLLVALLSGPIDL